MDERPLEPGSEDGWRVIDAAVRAARDRLGDELLSVYAIGSLAHGGFRPSVSDVDVALLTDERPDRDMRPIVAAIAAEVERAHPAFAGRLSIFHAPWARFSDPPPAARLPPIDRYDLVRHGVLVGGADLRPAHATAPTADEIRGQAVDFALRHVTPARLAADLRRLEADGVRVHDAAKMVLWPVRLQHVCDTGQSAGNAAAVEHYLRLPGARHRLLVHDALGWRELSTLPSPAETLERIAAEISDLNAEVLRRLGDRPGLARHDELARHARQLAS
jgi:hypothetical protein